MRRTLPAPAIVLIVGVTINRFGAFLQLFLVLYLLAKGLSAAYAGLALTVYGVGAVAGVLIGGVVTDRLGPRRTIVASMALSGLTIGAIPAIGTSSWLLLACGVAGAAAQLYRPAAACLLAEVVPRERLVMASAAYRLGLNVGAALGPLVGGLLLAWSYIALFMVDMATSLAFAGVAAMLLPRGDAAGVRRTKAGGYRTIARDRGFVAFTGALLVISIVEIQYVAVLPLEIVSRDLPVRVYSVLVALNALLVIGFELLLTRRVQHLPMRVAITAGIALIAAGFTAYGASGVGALFAATAVWTLGEIIAAPTVAAYPALVATEDTRGRYVACATGSQSIGYAVGPLLGASLWGIAGSGTWAVCGVVGAVAVAISWISVREPAAAAPTVADALPTTVPGPAIHMTDPVAGGSKG